jgi:hypothetical protein
LVLEYYDDDYEEMSSIIYGYKLSSDGKTLTINSHDNGKPVLFKKKE